MKFIPTIAGTFSGSVGGFTASHNRGGQYFRRRSVPTDPGSAAQVAVRGFVGNLAQEWLTALTDVQRAGWQTYAANTSWTDSLGQSIQLSGINHYIRSNTPRLYADLEVGQSAGRVDDAPTIFDLGVSPAVESAVLSHATGPPEVISLVLTWSNDASMGGGDIVLLYLSAPQNPTINFFKGPYYLVAGEGGDNPPVTGAIFNSVTATRYQDRFGDAVAGQKIFYQVRTLMEDGRLSTLVRGSGGLIPVAS